MQTIHALRARLVEGDDSIGARMRLRRWALIQDIFPKLDLMNVLDLGGTVQTWLRAPIRPAHVHIVNLYDSPEETPSWASVERADACEVGGKYADQGFDFVFSNSLIEHVGGHFRRERLAEVIRRSAPRYWVQTPYRYFPVEPHFLFPGFQFLPATARARIAQSWPLLHTPSADRAVAVSTVLSTELIGRTEMQHYFPDATIHSERIAAMTKSVIAVRK